jgi:hypothetical protein
LYLVFSVSSASTSISTYATAQAPEDPTNTYGPLTLLASGGATYAGQRWGDYVGVAQDPSNPSDVWQADEYPNSSGLWATHVSRLTRPDASGATYVPLDPTRLLDSRSGNGLSGAFKASRARTFQVTGRGGIPANAVGVTGNLTVTGQTGAGYLFVGPTATNSPTSSTLNFPVGVNRANGVTVALGTGGTLSVTYVSSAGKTAQVIFDVTGYFTP